MTTTKQNAGTKYDATLTTKQIAALIRTEARALVKTLPIVESVSVRLRGYNAIDCSITFAPGVAMISDEWADSQVNWNPAARVPTCHTAEVQAVLDAVEAIRNAYNYNNSDSQSDYFDVGYYGSTSCDWRTHADDSRRALEAAAARKAAAALAPVVEAPEADAPASHDEELRALELRGYEAEARDEARFAVEHTPAGGEGSLLRSLRGDLLATEQRFARIAGTVDDSPTWRLKMEATLLRRRVWLTTVEQAFAARLNPAPAPAPAPEVEAPAVVDVAKRVEALEASALEAEEQAAGAVARAVDLEEQAAAGLPGAAPQIPAPRRGGGRSRRTGRRKGGPLRAEAAELRAGAGPGDDEPTDPAPGPGAGPGDEEQAAPGEPSARERSAVGWSLEAELRATRLIALENRCRGRADAGESPTVGRAVAYSRRVHVLEALADEALRDGDPATAEARRSLADEAEELRAEVLAMGCDLSPLGCFPHSLEVTAGGMLERFAARHGNPRPVCPGCGRVLRMTIGSRAFAPAAEAVVARVTCLGCGAAVRGAGPTRLDAADDAFAQLRRAVELEAVADEAAELRRMLPGAAPGKLAAVVLASTCSTWAGPALGALLALPPEVLERLLRVGGAAVSSLG